MCSNNKKRKYFYNAQLENYSIDDKTEIRYDNVEYQLCYKM